MPKFDVDHWFDVVERDKPMMIFLVPAMAELITASPRFEAADLSRADGGVDRQRAARARDAEEAAGHDAAGVGDRIPTASPKPDPRSSRCRRKRRRSASARSASRCRRWRSRSSIPTPTSCAAADEVGELLVRLPGQATRVLQGRRRRPRARGPKTAGCAPATSRTSTTTASSTSRAASRT